MVDVIGWRIEIKSHPELTDFGVRRLVKKDKKPWQYFEFWKEGDKRGKYGEYLKPVSEPLINNDWGNFYLDRPRRNQYSLPKEV